MRRKRKKEVDETIPYEYRDLTSLPIPLDQQRGMWTKPEVIVIGGKDSNDAIMPCKVDSTGRLDVVGVCPEHQADAFLDQANPTSGTQYEVLAATELVRIYSLAVIVNWTVQPSPVEIHMTIDGVAHRHFLNDPASNSWLWAKRLEDADEVSQTLRAPDYQTEIAFLIEGRSVKVEAEITGGTVSRLRCRCKYAIW